MDYQLDYSNAAAMAEEITRIIDDITASMDKVNGAFNTAGGDTELKWFDEETADWQGRCAGNIEVAKAAMNTIKDQVNAAAATAQDMENL